MNYFGKTSASVFEKSNFCPPKRSPIKYLRLAVHFGEMRLKIKIFNFRIQLFGIRAPNACP